MAFKRITVVACFLVGICVLLIAVYALVIEISFVQKAEASEASIVEVRREYVAGGKGSALAYVPVVEPPGRQVRIRVDTSSEQPIYKVGDRIAILCDPSLLKCKRNTFVDKWGNFTFDLILSLVFLSIPLLLQSKDPRIREYAGDALEKIDVPLPQAEKRER